MESASNLPNEIDRKTGTLKDSKKTIIAKRFKRIESCGDPLSKRRQHIKKDSLKQII